MNQKKNGPPAADIESGATTDDDHLFDDLAKALMTPSAAERDLAVIPPVTEVQLEVVKAADPFASAITAFVAIHREVVYQEAEKLRAMIQAGEILAGIKAQGKADGSIPHGQWMDWCRENIEKSNDVSHQWVTRYMRAFSLKDDPRVTTDPEAVLAELYGHAEPTGKRGPNKGKASGGHSKAKATAQATPAPQPPPTPAPPVKSDVWLELTEYFGAASPACDLEDKNALYAACRHALRQIRKGLPNFTALQVAYVFADAAKGEAIIDKAPEQAA